MSEIKKLIKPFKCPLTQFVNTLSEKFSVITQVQQLEYQHFHEIGLRKMYDENDNV